VLLYAIAGAGRMVRRRLVFLCIRFARHGIDTAEPTMQIDIRTSFGAKRLILRPLRADFADGA